MAVKKIEDILKQPESDLVVNYAVDRYKKGLYSLTMVTGLPGTGKSSICFRLKELTVAKFEGKKVTSAIIENLAQLAKFAMDAKEDEINVGVIEEVSTLFPSRRAMTGTNVDLAKILDTCRKKKVILYANAPIWPSIDSHMRAMGTSYVEAIKVYKKVGIVLSKMFRLQTNPLSGKTYMHTMLRSGREVKRMFTRKSNSEEWKDYEIRKDEFMDNLYNRILKREEKRTEKENKELGIQNKIKRPARPLLPNEIIAYQLRVNEGKTFKEVGEALKVGASRARDILVNALKKLNLTQGVVSQSARSYGLVHDKLNLESKNVKNVVAPATL